MRDPTDPPAVSTACVPGLAAAGLAWGHGAARTRCRAGRVLLVLAACLFAAVSPVRAARGDAPMLRYDVGADGLGNLSVRTLWQDAEGSLWAGTEAGLYRHDGDRLRAVPIPMHDRGFLLRDVIGDGAGGLWIATAGYLLHRDAAGLTVEVPGHGQPLRPSHGAPLERLADGSLLMAASDPANGPAHSRGGLYRVQRAAQGGWSVAPALPASVFDGWSEAERGLRSPAVASDGSWWFGCGAALCRWSQERLQRWQEPEGVRAGGWHTMLEARDGSWWMASESQLLHWREGRFTDRTPPGLEAQGERITSNLVQDAAGRLIFGGSERLFRLEGGVWQSWGAAEGVEGGGAIQSLLLDAEGDLWFGTLGLGLARWRGYGRWTSWTAGPGLPGDSITHIEAGPDGAVWLATNRGLARSMPVGAQGGVPRFDVAASGLDSSLPMPLLRRDPQGGLWAVDNDGQLLRREADGRWTPMASGLDDLLGLAFGPDEVWLAGGRGLRAVDRRGPPPGVARTVALDADDADSTLLYDACTDARGRSWFGRRNGLLLHEPSGGLRAVAPDGLPARHGVQLLHCSGERLLLQTFDNEIYELDAEGRQALRIELPPALEVSVVSMLRDRSGRLWLGTGQGLAVREQGRWRQFRQGHGLAWDDCNQWALTEGPDGAIWIGTSRGLSRIDDPAALLAEAPPLPLRLAGARYGEQALEPGGVNALAWSGQSLGIEWTVPSFASREGLRTRYRLLGLGDAPWAETSQLELRYAGLAEGEYRLELMALDTQLGRSSPTLSLAFSIAPPWWRSLAFRLALLALLALAVAAGVRWRLRHLMRRQAELEAVVGERTRELAESNRQLAESHEHMRRLALTDGLTGAMNRRAIIDAAQREVVRVQRQGGALTLVLIDLDHFKRVNDRHGHPAGDALLRAVVQRLQAGIRESDLLGRYGGEEFLLLLPGLAMQDAESAARVQALCESIAADPYDAGTGTPLRASCSMGTASWTAGSAALPPAGSGVLPAADGAALLAALIARADAALYRAKQAGRNRVVMADDGALDEAGVAG